MFRRATMYNAVLLAASTSFSLFAQTNAVDGAVDGYVTDPSQQALSGARVSALNMETGIAQSTTTDGNGYYRFPLLPVGTYQITIAANGFADYIAKNLVLSVGQQSRNDVTLSVGATSQTVEVQGGPEAIDTESATVGAVLDRREVENLPIVSRNVYNFQLLSPGVIGVPSSTFGTTQYTFGGTERSQWNLDGLDDTQHGGNRQIRLIIVTPEAVAQTQTLANGYSAEFGRAAGGQVNVLLKSGTNQFHGSALGMYRPSDLQAIPTLSSRQPDRSWHDEAVTLGGPIIKDKLFFFGQFENNPYTLPNTITITNANASALGLPANQIGTAPFGETYRTLVGKVDYTLNEKNSGYVRYARFTNHQPDTASGLSIVDRGTVYTDHMNGAGVQLATIFTTNLLNELRFGTIQRDTQNVPYGGSAADGDAWVNISGVANIGYNPLGGTSTTERSTEVLDNVTWTHGRNTWKFGGQFDHTFFEDLTSTDRTFLFSGLAASGTRSAVSALNQYLNTKAGAIDPATGAAYTYSYFTTNSGNPRIRTAFNFIDGFAQDELRLSPTLTVNAGVRYELILYPTFNNNAPYAASRKVPNDDTDFAPRLAVTWSPTKSRKTVVHAAYGMYYDVPPLSTFYSAARNNGQSFLSYQVAGNTAGAPVFPNLPELSGGTFAVKTSISAFDQSYHNTYQHQANLQVQQELGHGFLFTAGYLYAAERHGLYTTDINLRPTGQLLADGRPVFAGVNSRPNTAFGAINLLRYGANTNFNGAVLTLDKRFSQGVEFTVNYMWSHALSDNIGEGGTVSDPTNIHRDYGTADNDVRHNLVIQGLYRPQVPGSHVKWLNGLELSTMTFMNSGMPINVIAGTDLNDDGVTNDRLPFQARNTLRGSGLSQVDAQAKRYFDFGERYHLAAFVGVENLLNTNNLNCNTTTGCTGSVINTANSSDLLRQTAARTARNTQVGLKFTF